MKKRLIIIFLTAVLLSAMFFVCASAAENGGAQIICIARDGECVSCPAYSRQAIKNAARLGADAASVGVKKTADGVLVTLRSDELSAAFYGVTGKVSETDYKTLSSYRLKDFDGSETKYHVSTLSDVLKEEITLVIDGWEYRDEIAREVKELSAENRVKLRVRTDADEAALWSRENGIDVIGIYYGNIIFSAISHIKALSDGQDSWVQLQSGNFFSVLFNSYVMKKCAALSVKPVCAMYDAQLCGKRTDTVQGFDDIISRGFSVIETNQPALLVNYIRQADLQKKELEELNEKAKAALANGEYSSASSQRALQAVEQAQAVLGKTPSQLEIQRCTAELKAAVKALCPPDGDEIERDSLNVTPGKVIAVIIFGALVAAAQVYVYKKKIK
ncbi:MAG: hypothetical protein MJ177_03435 [Clostridia bacterium]|nr:hypothetical protein [Clostridia bacterium]